MKNKKTTLNRYQRSLAILLLCLGMPMTALAEEFVVRDMREGVVRAGELSVEGDYVLLSPACASFDMYDNFEKRGDDFRKLVEELA